MKRLASAILVLLAGASVGAQWLKYPTPNVPRTADGRPNLDAPAPRLADGKPDFSGIWQLVPRQCAPPESPRPGLPLCGDDYPPGPEFLNLGSSLKEGLPYQPWARKLVAERTEQLGRDDPVGFCKPGGAVRFLTYPPFRKFLQPAGLFLILSERDVSYRQVFLDGRPLPEDPTPTPNGYSIGRWDGDTLVVQTVGFRDGTWLDRNGSPMTEAAKMTERFRRVNYGRVDVELTIDDPKAYTRPFTVTLRQRIVLDTELLDYYCNDNERDAAHMVGK